MGVVCRDRVYATPIVQIPNFILTIVHLEMLNVVIALRTWACIILSSSVSMKRRFSTKMRGRAEPKPGLLCPVLMSV